MKHSQSLRLFATLLIIFGITLQDAQKQQYVPYNDSVVALSTTYATPVQIGIPHSNINAEVKPGGVIAGKWILSESFVHYTGLINNTPIYYAHERENLFGNLKLLTSGDKIYIKTQKGQTIEYIVSSTQRILPTQIDKLKGNKNNTILLYTCDGAFDQYRLLVTAKKIH